MMALERREFLKRSAAAAASIVSTNFGVPARTSTEEDVFRQAAASSKIAGLTLTKVRRWLHEICLPSIDAATGLYRSRLGFNEWNYKDSAADCYPFVLWAAHYTDTAVLEGAMRFLLRTEQRLCNHIDRLPVDYDIDRKKKLTRTLDEIIFGASEYAKDGLVAIVELIGKGEWYERMKGIAEDAFKHAPIDTPAGRIPTLNIEVNGDLLQVLPRLFAMSGDARFLEWAHRVADYYLLPGKFVPSHLSDHGCEVVGGLGLLLALDRTAAPAKFSEYAPHVRYMCDEIIRRGTNSDGIIVGTLQPGPGPHDNVILRDGWGYDYVGFLDYDVATGESRYRKQIEFAMSNLLKPRYENFMWDHPSSRDNLADSVEGGLYLYNRLPVPQVLEWADREIARVLVDSARPAELWGTDKLECNTVRTALIHAMLHTRNTIARPWRNDLKLGAAPIDRGIAVLLEAERPYEGRLEFDIPRHRLYMGFNQDWPRMNTVPEWFTVEPDNTPYSVRDTATRTIRTVPGRDLRAGLAVNASPGSPARLIVQKAV